MSFVLTEKQAEANRLLGSDATHIMLFGGSRSGKTFLLCRAIAIRALRGSASRHAILRYRFNACKQSIWHDTWPKMMRLCFPQVPYKSDKQDWFFELPNKSQIWIGGLDEKERTEKILGQEYLTVLLNECSQVSFSARELVRTRVAQQVVDQDGNRLIPKMYYDENPPRKTHWTYRVFVNRAHPDTGRQLPDYERYASLQMNPVDNTENLPAEYLSELQNLSARQKLRFWSGEFGDANEGALWSMEVIERNRVNSAPELLRVVIAVDPSGTKGEEEDRSDYVGILVVGVGYDGHGYVLEDLSCKVKPAVWGRVAVTAYQRHEASAIVGEVNFGGAMVQHVIETAAAAEDVTVPYIEVRASRGKVIRAEPASALYEQNKVHHVGIFAPLEDQMCDMTTAGYMGDRSPDRVDALVWGLSDLFPSLVRQAASKEAAGNVAVAEPDPLAGW